MIIRRSRRYTVSMGNYESYSFGADVEMSHHDLGISDNQLKTMPPEAHVELRNNLTENVLAELSDQLHAEIQDAIALTDNQKSYLLQAFGIKKPPPRRRAK